jgi:ribosome-associated heat shock protein Hsp15
VVAKPERPGEARDGDARCRLDQWLWAARFYKTRTLAADAIDAGQARLNATRVKPAHGVREGDAVEVRKGGLVWAVAVTALSARRGSAEVAATLWRETEASRQEREREMSRRRDAAVGMPTHAGRPTKRDRRRLADFLEEP